MIVVNNPGGVDTFFKIRIRTFTQCFPLQIEITYKHLILTSVNYCFKKYTLLQYIPNKSEYLHDTKGHYRKINGHFSRQNRCLL